MPLQGSFEFDLKLQEFLELSRIRKFKEAVEFARKHFPSFFPTHARTIQRAMGSLAHRRRTSVANNKDNGSMEGEDRSDGPEKRGKEKAQATGNDDDVEMGEGEGVVGSRVLPSANKYDPYEVASLSLIYL